MRSLKMSVDEAAGWTPPAANVTNPTSLIFSENKGMVSLETVRKSNLEASNLENLVAVFGMFLCVSFSAAARLDVPHTCMLVKQ